MSDYSVRIEGLDRLRAMFKVAPQATERHVTKAVHVSALIVQRMARQESPVDSGRLRNSIGIKFLKLGARVSPGTKYALYVHEGTGRYARGGNGRKTAWVFKGKDGKPIWTRGSKPNPFMERASKKSEDSVQRAFEKAIVNLTQELGA